MSSNISIYNKLFKLPYYTSIDYIVNEVQDISFTRRYLSPDNIVETEDISIDVSQQILTEYIRTYANEFIDFLTDIQSPNSNEDIAPDDTDVDKRYKTDLYNIRIDNIKQILIDFLKNVNYIKRFKGSREYIIFILDIYLRMKLNQQYNLQLVDETIKLQKNYRYRITLTEPNYFGDGLLEGNVFIATSELSIDSNNTAQRLVSTDTTILSSGSISSTSRYLIVAVEEDYFFDGNVAGNVITNDGNLNNTIINSNNSVIELPPIIITKLGEIVYTLQSIITEEEWNSIIKPLVHPVGWLSYYYNMETILNINEFLSLKNINITGDIKYSNISYYTGNVDANSYEHYYTIEDMGNIDVSETQKINNRVNIRKSIIDFSLSRINVMNNDTDVPIDIVFLADFNNIVESFTTVDVEFKETISGDPIDVYIDNVNYSNRLIIKPQTVLDNTLGYTLTIKSTLIDIYDKTLSQDYEINFTTIT